MSLIEGLSLIKSVLPQNPLKDTYKCNYNGVWYTGDYDKGWQLWNTAFPENSEEYINQLEEDLKRVK